jgi:site-specific recombinase XerD
MAIDYKELPDYFREYLYYLTVQKNRSERTAEAYYIDLKGFLKYVYALKTNVEKIDQEYLQNIEVSNVTLEMLDSVIQLDVLQYLNYCKQENENSPKALARKMSSIRSFYKYLTMISRLKNNPVKDMESQKIEQAIPKFLTKDESIKLLQAVDGKYAPRDYCMLMIFLNCGVRLSELVGINHNDIQDTWLKVLGKGNKERYVYLNEGCLEAISEYTEYKKRQIASNELKIKDKDALFLSTRGTRLTGRRIEQIVEDLLKKAQLDSKGITVHKLRHTAATLMYREGHVDILSLQTLLGHSNVGTTQIYTHAGNENVKQAVQNNPLAQFSRTFVPEQSTEIPVEIPDMDSSPKKRRGRPPKQKTQ